MATLASEEWGIPEERFEVIPNGYFQDTVKNVDPDYSNGTRVAFLGTLHPKLDVMSFVDIARLPEVDEVAVIGDGAKRNRLKVAKRDHELDSLSLYGRLPGMDAYDIIAGSTLAINPQHESPLQRASSPVKLYYYAALGVPMVISEGPDVADELNDVGAATVVPHSESFHESVREVVTSESTIEEMSASARTAAQGWTWTERSKDLAALYDERTGHRSFN